MRWPLESLGCGWITPTLGTHWHVVRLILYIVSRTPTGYRFGSPPSRAWGYRIFWAFHSVCMHMTYCTHIPHYKLHHHVVCFVSCQIYRIVSLQTSYHIDTLQNTTIILFELTYPVLPTTCYIACTIRILCTSLLLEGSEDVHVCLFGSWVGDFNPEGFTRRPSRQRHMRRNRPDRPRMC